MLRVLAFLTLSATVVLAAGATSVRGKAAASPLGPSAALRHAVDPSGLRRHLLAFQRIADANGGNRAAGTPGYAASARYVYRTLARAGYRVRFQPFTFEQYSEHAEEGRQLGATGRNLAPEAIDYSPSTPRAGIRAQVVLVPVDADGSHGCDAKDFARAEFRGRIALVRRGRCRFSVKARRARDAGAAAVIVYNNAAGDFSGTLGSATTSDGRAWVPAVSVSDTTGAALKGKTGTVVNQVSDWDHYDGTSMATPHVTGAAALVWSRLASPGALSADDTVEDLLKRNAIDLGPAGYDTTYGYGLVNPCRAIFGSGTC